MAKMLPRQGENEPVQASRTARWMAALCYLNVLILIPACTKWRHEEFVNYHLNQGCLVLILTTLFAAVGFIPYCTDLCLFLTALADILSIFGLVNALRLRKAPLPLLGALVESFHPFS